MTKNSLNRFFICFGGKNFRLWKVKVKVKQSLYKPAHEGGKVVSPTQRPPLHPGNIPGTNFCWRLSLPKGQGHSAAGMITPMKNSNDIIGNRIRDLPACSAGSNLGPRKHTVVTTLPVNWDFGFWDLQVRWRLHNWIRAELLASFAANPGASSFCLSVTDFRIKQTKLRQYLSKLYDVQSQLLLTYQLLKNPRKINALCEAGTRSTPKSVWEQRYNHWAAGSTGEESWFDSL